jgi:hypothetical protein
MTALLDTRTAEKLSRICGLFSSHHSGERANAAAMADKLIRERGLCWQDVICFPTTQAPETLSELCGHLLAYAEVLTPWELDFLRKVSGFQSISPKQRDVLDAITGKVRAYRAAGGAA